LNEITTIFVSYHIICFTDFVLKPENKFLMGYSLIGFIGLNLTFGLVTLLCDMVKSFRLWLRRKLMLRKDKKIRTYMYKMYSPHALKIIVNAGMAGHSIQEE
jgi:hypothetical protein